MKKRVKMAGLLLLAALTTSFYACKKEANEYCETEADEYAASGTSSLKSDGINQVTIKYIYRNPEPATIGSYTTYSLNLITDAMDSIVGSTTTSNAVLYFYNEKTFRPDDFDYSDGKGCPVFMLGSQLSAANSGYVGTAGFDTITSYSLSGLVYYADPNATLPLPSSYGYPYRYSSGPLAGALNRDSVKNDYYTHFVIGNDIQGITDATQPVYIIKVPGDRGYYYYAFVVAKFKNGTTHTVPPVYATDMFTMTVKYKRIL